MSKASRMHTKRFHRRFCNLSESGYIHVFIAESIIRWLNRVRRSLRSNDGRKPRANLNRGKQLNLAYAKKYLAAAMNISLRSNRKKEELRTDPAVLAALQEWWHKMPKVNDVIDFEGYKWMLTECIEMAAPELVSEFLECVDEDWRHDTELEHGLNPVLFIQATLRFIDSVDCAPTLPAYVSLIQKCVSRLFSMQEAQRRLSDDERADDLSYSDVSEDGAHAPNAQRNKKPRSHVSRDAPGGGSNRRRRVSEDVVTLGGKFIPSASTLHPGATMTKPSNRRAMRIVRDDSFSETRSAIRAREPGPDVPYNEEDWEDDELPPHPDDPQDTTRKPGSRRARALRAQERPSEALPPSDGSYDLPEEMAEFNFTARSFDLERAAMHPKTTTRTEGASQRDVTPSDQGSSFSEASQEGSASPRNGNTEARRKVRKRAKHKDATGADEEIFEVPQFILFDILAFFFPTLSQNDTEKDANTAEKTNDPAPKAKRGKRGKDAPPSAPQKGGKRFKQLSYEENHGVRDAKEGYMAINQELEGMRLRFLQEDVQKTAVYGIFCIVAAAVDNLVRERIAKLVASRRRVKKKSIRPEDDASSAEETLSASDSSSTSTDSHAANPDRPKKHRKPRKKNRPETSEAEKKPSPGTAPTKKQRTQKAPKKKKILKLHAAAPEALPEVEVEVQKEKVGRQGVPRTSVASVEEVEEEEKQDARWDDIEAQILSAQLKKGRSKLKLSEQQTSEIMRQFSNEAGMRAELPEETTPPPQNDVQEVSSRATEGPKHKQKVPGVSKRAVKLLNNRNKAPRTILTGKPEITQPPPPPDAPSVTIEPPAAQQTEPPDPGFPFIPDSPSTHPLPPAPTFFVGRETPAPMPVLPEQLPLESSQECTEVGPTLQEEEVSVQSALFSLPQEGDGAVWEAPVEEYHPAPQMASPEAVVVESTVQVEERRYVGHFNEIAEADVPPIWQIAPTVQTVAAPVEVESTPQIVKTFPEPTTVQSYEVIPPTVHTLVVAETAPRKLSIPLLEEIKMVATSGVPSAPKPATEGVFVSTKKETTTETRQRVQGGFENMLGLLNKVEAANEVEVIREQVAEAPVRLVGTPSPLPAVSPPPPPPLPPVVEPIVEVDEPLSVPSTPSSRSVDGGTPRSAFCPDIPDPHDIPGQSFVGAFSAELSGPNSKSASSCGSDADPSRRHSSLASLGIPEDDYVVNGIRIKAADLRKEANEIPLEDLGVEVSVEAVVIEKNSSVEEAVVEVREEVVVESGRDKGGGDGGGGGEVVSRVVVRSVSPAVQREQLRLAKLKTLQRVLPPTSIPTAQMRTGKLAVGGSAASCNGSSVSASSAPESPCSDAAIPAEDSSSPPQVGETLTDDTKEIFVKLMREVEDVTPQVEAGFTGWTSDGEPSPGKKKKKKRRGSASTCNIPVDSNVAIPAVGSGNIPDEVGEAAVQRSADARKTLDKMMSAKTRQRSAGTSRDNAPRPSLTTLLPVIYGSSSVSKEKRNRELLKTVGDWNARRVQTFLLEAGVSAEIATTFRRQGVTGFKLASCDEGTFSFLRNMNIPPKGIRRLAKAMKRMLEQNSDTAEKEKNTAGAGGALQSGGGGGGGALRTPEATAHLPVLRHTPSPMPRPQLKPLTPSITRRVSLSHTVSKRGTMMTLKGASPFRRKSSTT